MKKFLVLYKSPVSAHQQMASATPEQGKAAMDLWMAWMNKAGKAIIDFGSPVAPVQGADGKIGGYSILQAESEKALETLLKDHPHRHAPSATIEVHEFLSMPGM